MLSDVNSGVSDRTPSGPPVGNDVVDLEDPRCSSKGTDGRFLDRVLAPSERAVVRHAADPDLALWRHWAAKEAAFKTVTHLRGEPPVFEHRRFVVDGGERGGVVRWGGLELAWRLAGGRHERAVHAIAWFEGRYGAPVVEGGAERIGRGKSPSLDDLMDRFTERERGAVHSPASALVRLGARGHLARLLDRSEVGLEVVCAAGPVGRTPPTILIDGRPSRWSVSLSHHGDLVGWILARWPAEGESAAPPEAPPFDAPEQPGSASAAHRS